MKRGTVVAVFLFLAVLLQGCAGKNETPAEFVQIGDILPVFTVLGEKDVVYNTAKSSGKTTLVCFFVTTCPDCHRELPKIQYVWNALHENQSIEIVCIGRGETLPGIASFWQSTGFTMPYYEDPDKKAFLKFATTTIPRLYLADEEGKIVAKWTENFGVTAEELLAVVKSTAGIP